MYQIIEPTIRTDRIVVEDFKLEWKDLETLKETKADFSDTLHSQKSSAGMWIHSHCADCGIKDHRGFISTIWRDAKPQSHPLIWIAVNLP